MSERGRGMEKRILGNGLEVSAVGLGLSLIHI